MPSAEKSEAEKAVKADSSQVTVFQAKEHAVASEEGGWGNASARALAVVGRDACASPWATPGDTADEVGPARLQSAQKRSVREAEKETSTPQAGAHAGASRGGDGPKTSAKVTSVVGKEVRPGPNRPAMDTAEARTVVSLQQEAAGVS